MKTGARLKQLRKESKLTLVQLSKLSGVAVATLSRMESDQMTGTLDAYSSICKNLGISLSEFFQGLESPETDIHLKRTGELILNKVNYSIYQLANKRNGKLKTNLINIKPNATVALAISKPGSEKCIYLLKGKVILNIAGVDYKLEKNNSIYFKSSFMHTLKNISSNQAMVLAVEC